MKSKFNIIKWIKKNKNKMNQQFSFTNFLNRKFQLKVPYGDMQMGEVVYISDFIGVEGEQSGYLVTKTRKRIKETDAAKVLVAYNPAKPAIPIFESKQTQKSTPDPYQKEFMLDEQTPLTTPLPTNTPQNVVTGKQNIAKAQEIVRNSNLFSAFENNKIKLSVSLEVNLPKWTFVRDMYKNATDKEDFITNLVAHVHKQITPDIIKSTVVTKLQGRVKNNEVKLEEKKSDNNADTNTKS